MADESEYNKACLEAVLGNNAEGLALLDVALVTPPFGSTDTVDLMMSTQQSVDLTQIDCTTKLTRT